jgi:hypothetical protein
MSMSNHVPFDVDHEPVLERFETMYRANIKRRLRAAEKMHMSPSDIERSGAH